LPGNQTKQTSEAKSLAVKFELGREFWHEFGRRLSNEVEVTPHLELVVAFGMSSEGVCNELGTHIKFRGT
jgi:hypothetical protein